MRKFLALVIVFFFSFACAGAPEAPRRRAGVTVRAIPPATAKTTEGTVTTVTCVRGQPCGAEIDLSGRDDSDRRDDLVPTPETAPPPADSGAAIAVAVIVGSVVVAATAAVIAAVALSSGGDDDLVVDVNLKNPPEMMGGM